MITTSMVTGTSMGKGNVMFDGFFLRAIFAGVGLALTTGPLGCFIIWRRMAYFGDTISHSALLGVALSLLFQFNLTLSVFGVAAAVSILLLFLQRRQALSADALLGILSHATLAIGLVMVAFMSWVRIDLIAILNGVELKSRAQAFRGGSMFSWLGGIAVDLRDAQLTGDAHLDVHSVFGGIAIRVPATWRVESNVKAIAGGVTVSPTQPADDAPTLRLDGFTAFGGIAVGARAAES